jgi:uncharacterized membrane protein YiaA
METRPRPTVLRRNDVVRHAAASVGTAVGGYVVYSIVVWLYQFLTGQPQGYALRSMRSGVYLGFAALLPAMLVVPAAGRAFRALRSPKHAPRAHEDVPAEPEPRAVGDPADGGVPLGCAPDAGAPPPGAERTPAHRGGEQHAPADVGDHETFSEMCRRVWRRRRARVIGWTAIIGGMVVWEGLGLWAPHFATLSHIVKVLEPPPYGRPIVFGAWIVLGGYVLGS